MTTLILMRGYPGSGKSTAAKTWLKADPENRIRVNRDDLRASLFNGEGVLDYEKEVLITKVQRDIAYAALAKGKSVLVDDMNLRRKFAVEWANFAAMGGHNFFVWDIVTPLEDCLKRNEARKAQGGRYVPPDALRDIAKRFPMPWPNIVADGPTVAPTHAWEPYVNQPGLPEVAIWDLDGTTALNQGRGWFDWMRVGEDLPNEYVIDLLGVVRPHVDLNIFLSGRDAVCFDITQTWLENYAHFERGIDKLFMRTAGDSRSDDIVKYELFNKHIRGKYNVRFVVDDRPKVCRLWRAMGLPLLQVGTGGEF